MKRNKLLLVLPLILLNLSNLYAQTFIIRKQAGLADTGGYTPSAPLALAALITQINGVATDRKGNFYFTVDSMNVVQKVTPDGHLSTFAGDGTMGFYGDGGPATSAKLSFPIGLVCDTVGNLFICDNNNSCIRKVDTNGIITRVVGIGGLAGWGGSGDGHRADSAQIAGGYRMAFDRHGNMYIADGNQSVRMVDTSGIIHTVVGGFGRSASVSTAGNGGPATAAYFGSISGVAVDTFGNIFVADQANNCVRVVRPNDTIYAFAGTGTAGFIGDNGPATNARLNGPNDIATDIAGNVFVADRFSNKIRKISHTDTIKTFAGTGSAGFSGEGGSPTSAALNHPSCLCLNKLGYVFIGDNGNYCVREVFPIDTVKIISNRGRTTKDTICAGTPLTFSVTVKHTGYCVDTVAWYINATKIAGNIDTITIDSLHNNDTVKCVMFAPGAGVISLASNKIVVTVFRMPTPISGDSSVCMGVNTTLVDTTSGGTWLASDTTIARVSSGGVITPVALGRDTIFYKIAHGCKCAMPITVNPNPAPILGVDSICSGIVSYLSDTDAPGFWSSSDTTILNVSPIGAILGSSLGTATITYSLPTGCIATKNITVNQSPTPISGVTVLCARSAITLSASPSGGSWSSNDSTIISVNNAGVITGIIQGSTIISYTLSDGCNSYIPATVLLSPALIDSLPFGITTMCQGLSQYLHESIPTGTWSSSDSSIVSVNVYGQVAALAIDTAVITYTLPDGCSANLKVIVDSLPSPIVGSPNLCLGVTETLTNLAGEGAWSVTNSNAAINPTTGVITGLSLGIDTVVFSIASGCATSVVITVNPNPASIATFDSICIGSSVTLTDSSFGGSWTIGDTTKASIYSSGLLTGRGAGATNVYYTLPTGCATNSPVHVKISPHAISGIAWVCAGNSATLSDVVSGGVWTTGTSSCISISSLTGVYGGISAGTATVTYTLPNSCNVITNVTVNPLPYAIAGGDSVCIGGNLFLSNLATGGSWAMLDTNIATVNAITGVVHGIMHDTFTILTYTLPTGCYVIQNIRVNPLPPPVSGADFVCVGATFLYHDSVSSGNWSTISSVIATINPLGILSGLTAGVDSIVFTNSLTGCQTFKSVTINPNPPPIIGTDHLCVGQNFGYHDMAPAGEWGSSNIAVVNIGGSGNAIALDSGTAIISYIVPTGCVAAIPITVNQNPHRIQGPDSICNGSSAFMFDSSLGCHWSSFYPSLISIDPVSGAFTANAPGIDSIICTFNATGCSTKKPLKVMPLPSDIEGNYQICIGSSTTLTDTIPSGIWNSFNNSVASFSSPGVLVGNTIDTVTVTYKLPNGCFTSALITVNPLPSPITGISSICVGGSTELSCLTPSGIWVSDSNNIAYVTTTGIVIGIRAGADTIVYMLSTNCTATAVVTVYTTPAPITGNFSLCSGTYTTLSDTTSGGYWSLSGTEIATVNSSGVVYGANGGIDTLSYFIGSCPATAIITVNASPATPVINVAPPASLCSNTLFQNFGTLPPVAGTGYFWTAVNAQIWAHGTGNQFCLVNFDTAAPAVITLTAMGLTDYCANSVSYTVYVSNSVSDSIGIIYIDNNFICLRSDESSYQWGYDNRDTLNSTTLVGETIQNYYNPSPDFDHKLYWVKTTRNGCQQKSYYNTPVGVGVVSIKNSENVTLFPNPSRGSFQIELPENYSHLCVEITDILGNVVLKQNFSNISFSKIPINLCHESIGSYIVKIVTDNNMFIKKLDIE